MSGQWSNVNVSFMKLYVNIARAVVQALEMIFDEGKYADKVIEKVLKQNPKWGARDRRFIAETTYDIVRWYRLLIYLSDAEENDFWKLLGAWCIWIKKMDLPSWDWEEFKGLRPQKFLEQYDSIKSIRKIRESIPDWLDELGEKELGKPWDNELHALNEEASVVLRVNTLKTTSDELREQLEEEEIFTEVSREYPDALLLEQRQNI